MSRFADGIEEHWEILAAFLTTVFGALTAFESHFAEISLETRFLMAGVTAGVAALAVAEMSRYGPTRSAGFHLRTKKPPSLSTPWFARRVTAILAMCALGVFLLHETATFHNVRVLDNTPSSDPFVGSIEIQPAHMPTTLTINLSTNQSKAVKIIDKAPASWNDQDPVDWSMQNDSPYGVTLVLQGFKSPQVFGVWYKLSARAQELHIEVTAEPAEVRVLRAQQLRRYRRNIWIFGGLLCVFALVFWSYRSSWFRPVP
jgi:hypothetical protein